MNTRSTLMLMALACLGTATGNLGMRTYRQSQEEDRYQEPKVPASLRTNPVVSIAPPKRTLDEVVSPSVIIMEPTIIEIKREPAPSKQTSQLAYQSRQLQQLIQDTIAYTQRTGKCALVARKRERLLDVYCSGQRAHQFQMDLGSNPVSDKLMQGDGTTPEGRYKVSAIKDRGQTDFYRAFLINYPNNQDWQEFRAAKRNGLIPLNASIGGEIEIHGHGGRGRDWTRGCMAIQNEEMDMLFDYIRKGMIGNGTPVTIVASSN